MEIRKRLTLQFTVIVAVILFCAEFSVYIFSELRWREDFYTRLQNKAMAVTKLLLDVEGVNADILRLIEKNNLSTMPFEEIHIFDKSNEEVFSSRDSARLVIAPSVIAHIRGIGEYEYQQDEYTMVGFPYHSGTGQIVVVAGAIDIYGLRKLANLRNILIIVFLISLIILYISGRIYANRALRPILKVIDEVPAITESTLHLRVNEGNGRDEVARLAKTFNKMLARLENAFKVQQTFIANASHEIRTPLAHISGQLEVSLLKERSKEEYIRIIRSVLNDIISLGNTANRLLLLTMTNADSYHVPMAPIRIDDQLWEAKAELQKTHPDFKIQIRFKGNFEIDHYLTTVGNDQLLRIVFLNLMENGCKYSPDHQIEVVIEQVDSMIRIHFKDKGIGIPREEQELVYEPFYRAKNVHKQQGSDLGLSLVKQIMMLHGQSISLVSEPEKGTEFILHFSTTQG